MAATTRIPQKKKQKQRASLISKLELPAINFNDAAFIPHEDAVITVSTDRSIRVWIQRSNGQYWPSICHYMPDVGTCIDYNKESGKVFVGQTSGIVQEYDLSDDCNKLVLKRDYYAHSKQVRDIFHALDYNWLLSCSNDKQLNWHSTESGKRLGGYHSKSACNCLQFDSESCYLFIGNSSGEIHVVELKQDKIKPVTTLNGHSGSVQSLCWDPEKKWLYSGSFDESVIIWDIGGQKGSALELHGHNGKIYSIGLAPTYNRLFTADADQMLAIWNMLTKRIETPTWSQTDMCEKCAAPFFWNFRQMWDERTVGVRQHHCRRCGRAVCHSCSEKTSILPIMGYEFEVRVCNDCFLQIKDEEKISTTSFQELKHNIRHLKIDLSKRRMLTCGADDIVKIWDIQHLLIDDKS